MQFQTLHEGLDLRWMVFGRDAQKPDDVIDTNEYLIVSGDQAMMLDPGGQEIFPSVLTAISQVIEVDKITTYLCSHQDPDIMSSLPLWLSLTPKADIYLSWLWGGFISHFGHEFVQNFRLLQDEGETISLGNNKFVLVPAHHCHSAGNFHLFDPQSRILFSGDMGASLLPPGHGLFVEDFNAHIGFMETFHKRWMPSNEAKLVWIERVRRLNPRMICPQHGAIFVEDDVGKFLDWLEDLDVGRIKKFAA